jgi:hypothetical protein
MPLCHLTLVGPLDTRHIKPYLPFGLDAAGLLAGLEAGFAAGLACAICLPSLWLLFYAFLCLVKRDESIFILNLISHYKGK